MAARTATPTATASPIQMNPTTTEHDWRFPRRPDHYQQIKGPDHSDTDVRPNLDDPDVDIHSTNNATKDALLGPALFPMLQNANAGNNQSIEQMQQDDPLATQIWKFFGRTKQQVPNQHRMENMTWRMMALQMRKQQQDVSDKYDISLAICSPTYACSFSHHSC